MKLYSHRNAANNRHIIKHSEKIYTKYNGNDMTTIIVMTTTLKKVILTLAANTIQHHRGPWKTCKVLSLKVPVSACHVTGNT